MGLDFGNIQKGDIAVNVYNDVNSNKMKDTGEKNMEGFTITLKDSAGNVVETKTTDSTGNVKFASKNVGNYTVEITDRDGYIVTTEKVKTASLSVMGVSIDFGVTKKLVKTGESNMILQILSWF